MTQAQPHSTTFKVRSQIGNGIRMMAAIKSKSVADMAEEAVARILQYHSRPVERMPRKTTRAGRPSVTVEQAAETILRSKPNRNEPLPTRLTSHTAQELDELAEELGTRMNHLAEQGAIRLLQRAPWIVKSLAGLNGDDACENAIEAVRRLKAGELTSKQIASLKGFTSASSARTVLEKRTRARIK